MGALTNCVDLDQAHHFVELDIGPRVCKDYQQTVLSDKGVKASTKFESVLTLFAYMFGPENDICLLRLLTTFKCTLD